MGLCYNHLTVSLAWQQLPGRPIFCKRRVKTDDNIAFGGNIYDKLIRAGRFMTVGSYAFWKMLEQ